MNTKAFAALVAVCLAMTSLPGVTAAVARPSLVATRTMFQRSQLVRTAPVAADLCPLCVQFTSQAINQLLNLILNGAVVGSCGALCGALAQKTGSQALGEICTLLCDIEGVEEFIKLIEKADLDPILFCETLKTCPIFDGGDATIDKITVDPAVGPQGLKTITISYTSKNGTGTGEVGISIETVDGNPLGQRFFQEPLPAGSYNKTLQLKAERDPDCDPTQGPCENWLPGNYTVKAEICNGECGSAHSHSQVYDRATGMFEITED